MTGFPTEGAPGTRGVAGGDVVAPNLPQSQLDTDGAIIDAKVVHDCLGVDEDIVWQVVTEALPPLIASLEKILKPLSNTND